jgi:hypothetical protein
MPTAVISTNRTLFALFDAVSTNSEVVTWLNKNICWLQGAFIAKLISKWGIRVYPSVETFGKMILRQTEYEFPLLFDQSVCQLFLKKGKEGQMSCIEDECGLEDNCCR